MILLVAIFIFAGCEGLPNKNKLENAWIETEYTATEYHIGGTVQDFKKKTYLYLTYRHNDLPCIRPMYRLFDNDLDLDISVTGFITTAANENIRVTIYLSGGGFTGSVIVFHYIKVLA